MLTFLPSNPNRLHRSLPTAEQDAERPAWHRSVPPRGRGRERCGLHWNESSARAGAFLGGAIQVIGILAAFGYVGWTEYLSPFLEGTYIGQMPVEGIDGLTMFGSLKPLGWGLAAIDLLSGNYLSAAYGFATSFFGIPVPFFILKRVYDSIAGAYNERL